MASWQNLLVIDISYHVFRVVRIPIENLSDAIVEAVEHKTTFYNCRENTVDHQLETILMKCDSIYEIINSSGILNKTNNMLENGTKVVVFVNEGTD
jgi:hypothetical protein